MSTVTRLDYCQFLLVTQTNYTLTYFAEHSEKFSHDAVKRYLEDVAADLVSSSRLAEGAVNSWLFRPQREAQHRLARRVFKSSNMTSAKAVRSCLGRRWT